MSKTFFSYFMSSDKFYLGELFKIILSSLGVADETYQNLAIIKVNLWFNKRAIALDTFSLIKKKELFENWCS